MNHGFAAGSAPRNPAVSTPARRAHSGRRTSTIDTHWPDGYGQPMVMAGTARDLLTGHDGEDGRELATGAFTIAASPSREILSISVSPDLPEAQALVGVRAGGASRAALSDILRSAAGGPLFQILDDFSGASLVAPWAWTRWVEDWHGLVARSGAANTAGRRGRMEGICVGFAPGSTALDPDGGSASRNQSSAPVAPLGNEQDPAGWHRLADQQGPAMRRARRLDLWRSGDTLEADLFFQDSAVAPDGSRLAVHEYLVRAAIDPATMHTLSLTADPRILPYRQCPGAAANVDRMIGQPILSFRRLVPTILPGTLGCTHLNDVLRSLADVPALAEAAGLL